MSSISIELQRAKSNVTALLELLCNPEPSLETSRTILKPLPPALDALDLLSTAATITKAQTTKLTLLLSNESCTSTALSSVLRVLLEDALPHMVAAARGIDPKIWTSRIHADTNRQVKMVLTSLHRLLEQSITRSEQKKNTPAEISDKDLLATTGIIWEACDGIIQLKTLGLVGIVVKMAEQWKSLLQDAIKELKDWSEDVDSASDGDDYEDQNDETKANARSDQSGKGSNQEAMDAAFDFLRLRDDSRALQAHTDQTLKKLRLIDTLYAAIIKRRLRTLPVPRPAPSSVSTLDSILEKLSVIPDHVDELIGEYYEDNPSEAAEKSKGCISLAKAVVNEISLDWEGKEDNFTTWSKKWIEAIDIVVRPDET